MATGDGNLYYLEVGDATLTEKERTKLANKISCFDITPIGKYPDYSHKAAVGLWNGSVMILSLPELAPPICERNLGTGDWTAVINSVLMCDLQGVYFAGAFIFYFGFSYILFDSNKFVGSFTDMLLVLWT